MKKNILEKRFEKGPILVAEGYLFEIERRGYLKAGAYVPEVVLDFPNALRELHREFLRAGSDVMEAFTYYANRKKLRTIGRENDLEPMNRQALRIAKEVAKEGNALVAGNICNTWAYDPSNKKKSEKIVRAMYEEQLQWAVEEGADFIISETNDFLGEALIGLEVIQKYKLPAVINFATVQGSKTVDGYDYVDACKVVKDAGADVVGLNCSRGPATMLPIMEKIRQAVDGPIAALPVTYNTTPEFPTMQSFKKDGRKLTYLENESFLQTRYEVADFGKAAQKIGIDFVGLCCGSSPYLFRSLAESFGRVTPASRYSPGMEFHPMWGSKTTFKEKDAVKAWKD